MAQSLNINRYATLPELRLELISNGRNDFNKIYDLLQSATITFSMKNKDTGVFKIAGAPCYLKLKEDNGCVEQYIICYQWKKRDTNEYGIFEGRVKIEFDDTLLNQDGTTYPSGDLIVPTMEDLEIVIK
jgi:hypothetical protein